MMKQQILRKTLTAVIAASVLATPFTANALCTRDVLTRFLAEKVAQKTHAASSLPSLDKDDILKALIASLGNRAPVFSPDKPLGTPDKPETPVDEPAPPSDEPQTPTEKPHQTADKPAEPETPAEAPSSDAFASENAAVNEVISLVNEYRKSYGLTAVALDETLCKVASLRASEIVSSFSHTRPNGTSCFTALAAYGVNYRGAGENIAYGQRSASEVMTAWMNSEGHRANILNASFTRLGVGVVQKGNTLYWAQMFTY